MNNAQTPSLTISKLDASRRQLEVAIRLYFSEDDPVSTYTLASAAYGILRDTAAARQLKLFTGEQRIIERVVPGKERELLAALRRHQNFFKHADRDPDGTIDFRPESTEWILFDGCVAYAQLTGETTPLMGTLNLWWQFHNRDLIKAEFAETKNQLESNSGWFTKGRGAYFSKVLPLLQRSSAA